MAFAEQAEKTTSDEAGILIGHDPKRCPVAFHPFPEVQGRTVPAVVEAAPDTSRPDYHICYAQVDPALRRLASVQVSSFEELLAKRPGRSICRSIDVPLNLFPNLADGLGYGGHDAAAGVSTIALTFARFRF